MFFVGPIINAIFKPKYQIWEKGIHCTSGTDSQWYPWDRIESYWIKNNEDTGEPVVLNNRFVCASSLLVGHVGDQLP